MSSLLQDLRYALRQMQKHLRLSIVVIVTLALGVGANTAIFSIVNGWLFRPLPVPLPQQIVVLAPQQETGPKGKFSYADLVDFRQQQKSFSEVFAYQFGAAGLTADGKANEFVYSAVTGNYFNGLQVHPAVGRLFLPHEGETAGEPIRVVLGFSFWKKKLGADSNVIGKLVSFNGRPATVIGVAPEGFHGSLFAFDMDGYVSLSAVAGNPENFAFWTDRSDRELSVQARLRPGNNLSTAKTEAALIAQRLADQFPATNHSVSIRVIPENLARPAPLVANFAPVIAGAFLTFAAVVLLLACVNVTGMLMAQAMSREREMAIRAAIGAGRFRLLRQVIIENLLLAAIAGVLGLAVGYWALTASGSLLHSVIATPNFGYHMDCSFDLRVFAYTFIAVILTGLAVALWPATRATRKDVSETLHGTSTAINTSTSGFRNSLIVAQLAASFVLLVAAGLFTRSLVHAEGMFLGFEPDHLLTALMDPQQIGYGRERTDPFYRELKQRVRALPGVQSISLSSALPMEVPGSSATIHVPEKAVAPGQKDPSISFNAVDTDFFQTMQTQILRGRAFLDSDVEGSPRVAIVNATMAKRLWQSEDVIGKHFNLNGANERSIEVVGVAADGQYMFVSPEPQPYFYVPLTQEHGSFRTLQVKSTVPPESLIPSIQEQIQQLAPGLPIIDVRTMDQVVQGLGGLFIFRLAASLAALLGAVGLTLAIVGVYGAMSFATLQRTPEFGIRIALGADHDSILNIALWQGARLVALAVVIGLTSAFGVTHAMTKLLVGVTGADPLTLGAVVFLLTGTALLACYIPARRAAKVDPMVALRYE